MIETNCIEVNCQGADVLPIDRIMEFQGKLKKLSEKNRERLKASILKHGFISPCYVNDISESKGSFIEQIVAAACGIPEYNLEKNALQNRQIVNQSGVER